jgi:hypothetical protein
MPNPVAGFFVCWMNIRFKDDYYFSKSSILNYYNEISHEKG